MNSSINQNTGKRRRKDGLKPDSPEALAADRAKDAARKRRARAGASNGQHTPSRRPAAPNAVSATLRKPYLNETCSSAMLNYYRCKHPGIFELVFGALDRLFSSAPQKPNPANNGTKPERPASVPAWMNELTKLNK